MDAVRFSEETLSGAAASLWRSVTVFDLVRKRRAKHVQQAGVMDAGNAIGAPQTAPLSRSVLLTTCAIAVILFCRCSGEVGSSTRSGPELERRHPIADSLLSNTATVPVHGTTTADTAGGERIRADLAMMPESAAVGMLEGDTALVLGEIKDALIMPGESLVALLDTNYGKVRLFSLGGLPLASFGEFGRGPGQFTSPVRMEFLDDEISVLDAAMKIERYRELDSTWQGFDTQSIPFVAQDFCRLDDRIAVLGLQNSGGDRPAATTNPQTLHLLASDGRTIPISFSGPYAYSGTMALWYLTQGHLACDPRRGLIWVAYSILHEVHAFDADGHLRWITRLSDAVYPALIETAGTRVGEDLASADRVDVVSNVSLITSSLLAVQLESRTVADIQSSERNISLRTYFIDALSGLSLGVVDGDSRVIGGGNGRVVLYREEPFPQMAVVDMRPRMDE